MEEQGKEVYVLWVECLMGHRSRRETSMWVDGDVVTLSCWECCHTVVITDQEVVRVHRD